MRKIYILILIFILPNVIWASDQDFSYELISVSQGLPNSQINFIFQGNKGNMWIGTANGLCLYDGYTFSVLQSFPFDSTTFADDNIIGIAQDRNNNIWLHTHYGIEFLNISTGVIRRVKYIKNENLNIKILPSKTENLVYLLYDNNIEKINISDFSSEIIFNYSKFKIYDAELYNRRLILLTDSGILQFDPQKSTINECYNFTDINNGEISLFNSSYLFSIDNQIYYHDTTQQEPKIVYSNEYPIISLSRICNDKLVFADKEKIIQLKFDDQLHIKKQNEFLKGIDFKINDVLQDASCLIWVATGKGIIKINPYSKKISHEPIKLWDINTGRFIVETSKRGIVYQNSKNENIFYHSQRNKFYKIPLYKVTSVCLLDDNTLLTGTSNGMIRTNLQSIKEENIQEFQNQSIHHISMLDEQIWISSDRGIYFKARDKYKLICPRIIQSFIIGNNELFYTDTNGFGILKTKSCWLDPLLQDSNSMQFVHIFDLLQSYDGKIWLATDDGLYRFKPKNTDNNEEVFSLVFKGKVYSLVEAENLPEVWFASDLGIGSIDYQTEQIMLLGYEDGIRTTSFLPTAAFVGKGGKLEFLTDREIISLYPDSVYRDLNPPDIYLSNSSYINHKQNLNDVFISNDTIIVNPGVRNPELNFTTLDYYAPLHTQFEYNLSMSSKQTNWWVKLESNKLSLGGLKPGIYKLKVRAINSHGVKSRRSKDYIVIVKAPLLQSRLAYLVYGTLLVVLIILLIHFRTRNLRRINREYKEKEIIAKKIELQKEELTIKNKNITDSINYARRIQLAMMPSGKNFSALFPDSFILHMPKDIVSGDFYWVNKVGDKEFFSAVDCTGHGVPGAFMSIIGVELFRRITEIENLYTPAEILNSLSKNFDRVFGDVDEMKLRDGMDLAFCALNKEHTMLEFSGAFNPLYIIRDNSIIEIKGDRQSVGVFHDEDGVRSFNNHVIPLQDQDLIYIFTDGFADQFGGPEEKKYKYRRFRHLLLALHQLPMVKQEEFLRKSILEWRGELDQVDDILVMGVRIHQNK